MYLAVLAISRHVSPHISQVKEQLLATDAKYAEWGFEGDGGPTGQQLIQSLFSLVTVARRL